VLAHPHALLKGNPEGAVAYLDADLRHPEEILGDAAKTLDFSKPVGLPEVPDFAEALNERQFDAPLVLRDHAQVTSFFEGLDLVEPGFEQLPVAWICTRS
jgi:hypothetical protein